MSEKTKDVKKGKKINEKKAEEDILRKAKNKKTQKKVEEKKGLIPAKSKSLAKKAEEKKDLVPAKSKSLAKKAEEKKDLVPTKSKSLAKKAETKKDLVPVKSKNAKASKAAKQGAKKAKTKKAVSKKVASKKTASKKAKAVEVEEIEKPQIIEYYDLPYRYNQTIIKTLYQTPSTLFVYWDISDADRENFKKQYGENFFETSKPVLIITNETMNYKFQIEINDFANSWYFKVNDTKCEYKVELGRIPIEGKREYIYVTSSNTLETPNNKILFSTNENNTVIFKNVKTQETKQLSLGEIISKLKNFGEFMNFPLIKSISGINIEELYKSLYETRNIDSLRIWDNPSSKNLPTSSSISSSRVTY